MSYESVDALQQVRVESVFHYAQDRKTAAGRALGTLIEIITYDALKAWGFRDKVAIERPPGEYGNPAIAHNVEFSLHPVLRRQSIALQKFTLPLTSSKLRAGLDVAGFADAALPGKAAQVLSRSCFQNSNVLRQNVWHGFGSLAPIFGLTRTPETPR